jgi:hypothetical protein
MITIEQKGDFKKFNTFCEKLKQIAKMSSLDKYGQKGVEALKSATPKDSGITASSWEYSIKRDDGSITLEWNNTNVNDGCNIALLIQYGHGTRTGGYVSGVDYINPSLKPIFDEIEEDLWKEVTKL